MTHRCLILFACTATASVAISIGCGSSSSTNTGSAAASTSGATTASGSGGGAPSTGVTSSSGAGQGGAGGSMGQGGATGQGGAGGASPCAGGIDTECEKCAFAKCQMQAQKCADHSMCDAQGNPTSGCLKLVECAAKQCGGSDFACVSTKCSKELQGAGGLGGAGTQAALALGTCVQMKCAKECTMQ